MTIPLQEFINNYYVHTKELDEGEGTQFKLFSFPLHKNTIVIIRSVNYEGAARDAAAVLVRPRLQSCWMQLDGDGRFPSQCNEGG